MPRRPESADRPERAGAGLPGVAAETVVVDHGKIYLSEHLLSVCERLGISVQPARPLTPTDKAAVERFFAPFREGLLVALPGYKGPDVYSRGADPEGCAYFFIDELELIIREWIGDIYHRRPHERAGRAGRARRWTLSPAEMFEAGPGPGRAAADPGPPGAGLRLPAGRLAHDPALRRRGRRAALQRPGADPLPQPDAARSPACTPANGRSATTPTTSPGSTSRTRPTTPGTPWSGSTRSEIAVPFSADTLAYARRLALAAGRHVDERRALAELLERWDAGLVRNPAERRMAVRASEQRAGPPAPPRARGPGAGGRRRAPCRPAGAAVSEHDGASCPATTTPTTTWTTTPRRAEPARTSTPTRCEVLR